MGRLHEAFSEALEVRDQILEPSLVRLAADLAQLLVRQRGMDVGAHERLALDEVLSARTGIAPQVRQVLLELALAPQYRTELSTAEVDAFEQRFGPEAGGQLREEQRSELDLAGFAERYGAEEALLLLDALFRVAAADGAIHAAEARRLDDAASQLGVDGVLLSALFQRYDPRYAAGEITWELEGDRVTVGRSAGNDIVLSDPQVARHHCTFVKTGDHWRVVDAKSGRPVLVDGEPVPDSRPLTDRSVVRIGPWELRVIDGQLRGFGNRSFKALSVRDLDRKIGDIVLLEDMSFTVFSGELIALVGPSGAGKTTLINAIAGIAPADSGAVMLGDEDFHAILEGNPSAVGIVPQDDLVHPELAVEESLFYSGRLRYPADVASAEVRGEVDRVLQELDIEHIRKSRIGDALKRGISGGQRKRVNLGQELLTRSTRVLFLDEPTSGLDPRSAQSIVRQVRQLADQGRIVFLVTHDLTPAIMDLVDHLLVMLPGGRLGYIGPPRGACRFFGVESSDKIFDVLGQKEPTEWAAEFRESADFKKYVTTREHLLVQREELKPAVAPAEERSKHKPPGFFTQLTTLTARYMRTKLRDKAGLAVLTIQPPILALLIWLVFPVPTTRLMFMLSLSCLWFGMSIGVRELIIDRTIWRRERKVGVGVTAYLGSKLLVLGALNALQCFAFTAIVHQTMGLGKYGYSLLELGGAEIATGLVGMTLGLMLSALYTSSEAAVGTLPLLLIPNICFSSIMVSLRDMTELPTAITWVTMQRYAFDLSLKVGTHLEDTTRIPGKWEKKPITGPLYDLGLKGADVEDMGLEIPELYGALAAFAVVFLVITWVGTWARDRA